MRLLMITIIFTTSLLAMDFSTRYDVDVNMFGKVGYADLILKEDADNYEIKLTATTTGTAATLTGNRIETYISKGHIIANKYMPETFVKIKKTTRGERVQTYRFDHLKQEITLIEEESKVVSRKTFDALAFKLIEKDVLEHSNSRSILPYYNEDDLLSSYLNTKQSCNAQHKEYDLLAVGAHNDKKKITLSFLEGSKRVKALDNFSKNTDNIYNLKVTPIDKEEKTVDVLIAFDSDGHMKEAVLDDVFWIGEVKATRVYHQVASKF